MAIYRILNRFKGTNENGEMVTFNPGDLVDSEAAGWLHNNVVNMKRARLIEEQPMVIKVVEYQGTEHLSDEELEKLNPEALKQRLMRQKKGKGK